MSDIVFLPSSVLSASGFRVSFREKRFSAMGSPENCTVDKLYANVWMDSSILRSEKIFSNFTVSDLQLFARAVILRVVVGQSSKRVNGVKQLMLIAGIVMVGLFDLAFTTFINHEELVRMPSQPPIEVANNELSASIPLPLDSDPDGPVVLTDASVSPTRYAKVFRSAKLTRNATVGTVARRSPISHRMDLTSLNASLSNCRTITYPFIGDEYVVQLTDDTGCLSSASLRSRRDHFIAKAFAPRQKRW